MRKELTRKLLSELLKDSKRSDRELAKVLGVSQPTITRKRNRPVAEGIIREFTIIPDFAKMGYEIMAISCVKTKTPVTSELAQDAAEWMKKFPNIIFVAGAEGFGKNGVMISLHKNYTEYSKFVRAQVQHWKMNIQAYDSMLIGLKGTIAKPLSLSYLAEEKSEDQP